LIALLMFLLSFAIGYFSSTMDSEFPRVMLGDSYLKMTAENIKSGDPMRVYKESGHFDMTLSIMANNIYVTLFCFLLGIVAGIGSVAFMMYNGVVLGAFLQYFAQNHLLREANLTVWMHGTLEISAIIVGTAAGITLGKGLIFPGTYSRLQAFQMSARKGIKIMAAVLIMLVFAALIEGNLTRITQAGDLFRGVFIAFCLFGVLFYYAWYPFYKARKGFSAPIKEASLAPDTAYRLSFDGIKSSGDIFEDTFYFFKKHIGYYMKVIGGAAALFCVVVFLASASPPDKVFALTLPDVQEPLLRFLITVVSQFQVMAQFFVNAHIPFLLVLDTLFYTLLAAAVYDKVAKEEDPVSKSPSPVWSRLVGMFAVCGLSFVTCLVSPTLAFYVFSLVFPFIALWMFSIWKNGLYSVQGYFYAWGLARGRWGMLLGSYYLLALMGYLLFSFANSIFVDTYLNMVSWNMHLTQVALDNFMAIFTAYICVFALFAIFALIFTGTAFTYFSLMEISEARGLLARIEEIGMSKKIKGLMRE